METVIKSKYKTEVSPLAGLMTRNFTETSGSQSRFKQNVETGENI
jgi:hypothetical protein